MITIRRSEDRGRFDHGWLDTRHTFSFGAYYDPEQMGFGSLRVINEDRVRPGQGFGTHGHRDMEIISYVLDGALEHRDSMGHGSVLTAGMLQRMSAGTGVEHSEFNHSRTDPVHFYQIWIVPERRGGQPSYEERSFAKDEHANRWQLIASSDGRDDSMTIQQDADLYRARFDDGARLTHESAPGRRSWVQVVRGGVNVNGHDLSAGDGAAIEDEDVVAVKATSDAEVLLFDLS